MSTLLAIDPAHEYRLLRRWHEEAEGLLGRDDDFLLGVREEVSAWSPAQHLCHTAAATGMMLKGVLGITRGLGDADGAPNRAGRYVLLRERIARGVAQAPERLRPPADANRALAQEALARSREKLYAVGAILDELGQHDGRLPHPYLGLLGGLEWFRVARIHAEHHLHIIRDIEGEDT